MKKFYLTFLLIGLILTTYSPLLHAQDDCFAQAGTPTVPLTSYCSNDNTPEDLIVTEFEVAPAEGFDSEFVVTDADGTIIAVTEWAYTGVRDDIGLFAPDDLADGTYTFTNFVFLQSELDMITNNALAGGLIGAQGGESLAELLELVKGQIVIPVPDPLTIQAVLDVLANDVLIIAIGFAPCVSVTESTYDITFGCGVGIEEQAAIDISVGPNPSSDFIQVTLPNFTPSNRAYLQLSNSAGQILAHQKIVNYASNLKLDVHHLPAGVYLVEVNTGDARVSKKVLIQH